MKVYLVQTDTTVGFLSQDAAKLARRKGRSADRPFLKALPDLAALREIGRVPRSARRLVRRADRTSFVLPNGASFRVVSGSHREWLARCGWCFTTSANRHGEAFDEAYAREACDVIVEGPQGYRETAASTIWRLGRRKRVRLR